MKTKLSLLGIYTLMICSLLSCQKDDHDADSSTNYRSNARLKQVLLYSDINATEPISIAEEYEYDANGRLSKISVPMYENGARVGTIKYDLYEYNALGQLERIRNYNANINSGFTNLKNKTLTYSADGIKTRETIEYPMGGITEYFNFEYQNGLPSKVTKYYGTALESYTVFQYDNSGRLIKESFYGSVDNCFSYTIHSYTGSLNTKSELYKYPSNEQYRLIQRTFDSNNNLITLESKELSLYSSMMSHVLRYIYYD